MYSKQNILNGISNISNSKKNKKLCDTNFKLSSVGVALYASVKINDSTAVLIWQRRIYGE